MNHHGYTKRDGDDGPGIIYKENAATDLTSMLTMNNGANVFIRRSKEKKSVRPSLCPKTHCPSAFQYSIGYSKILAV